MSKESKKVSVLRRKVVETVEKISDEACLTALLIFANQAAKDPKAVKSGAVKASRKKSSIRPETKIADTVAVLEYKFKDKDMIAIQAQGGKPKEAVLATLRDFKEAGKLRYYVNVPENPFKNQSPFWAGKADDALKAALMAVA